MPRPANPLHACLAIACAMHVTASFALAHVHRHELPPEARAHAEAPGEVSIEEMTAPALEAAAVATDDAPPRAAEASATRMQPSAGRPGLAGTIAASTEVLTQGAASAASADGWTLPTTRRAPNLFEGATASLTQPFDMPPRANPSDAHSVSRTGGLVEGLDASDRDKGLGRGGPVLSAVEEAAHSADAPEEGFAEYEVVVRRAGPIEVFLLRANDDREKWEEIAPAIQAGVSARHVLIPGAASAMRFVVHVEARIQFPDGKRRADLGNKAIATTGWGGKYEPGLSSPGVPMVGVVHTGKVCSVGVVIAPGMVALGGACSPENIGNPPTRVVRGRVVSESRLD